MSGLSRYQRILLLSFTFFALMILVAMFHEDGILASFKFQEDVLQLREQNHSLKKENEMMAKQIEDLKTDPYAVEKIAREKLNLVHPGERIYKIVPAKEGIPELP